MGTVLVEPVSQFALMSAMVNPPAPVPSASEKSNVTSNGAFAWAGPLMTTVGATVSAGRVSNAICSDCCGRAGTGMTVVPAVAAFCRTERTTFPAVFAAGVTLTE